MFFFSRNSTLYNIIRGTYRVIYEGHILCIITAVFGATQINYRDASSTQMDLRVSSSITHPSPFKIELSFTLKFPSTATDDFENKICRLFQNNVKSSGEDTKSNQRISIIHV